MIEPLKNLFKSKKVPHIAIDGRDQITKLSFVAGAEEKTNIIFNAYDLLGYEKRSDTVEIFDNDKYLGRGYFADISGITVNIDRTPGESETFKPDLYEPEIPKAPGVLAVIAHGLNERIDPEWKDKSFILVPCVLLVGEKRIEEICFQYLRLIPSGYLIDDKNHLRYKIAAGMNRIDITSPNGKTDRGYVLDTAGYTVTLHRRIKVFAVDEKGNVIRDKEGSKVEVSINFSGIIGQQATAERLTLLMSIVSGRERMVAMFTGLLIGQILMMVLHI